MTDRMVPNFESLTVRLTLPQHKGTGTLNCFWGDRFKSVIVDKGETLVNCLAYIDLNPLRAGIVKQPEEYRWSSIGYHMQTNNKDKLLSTDLGLQEFNLNIFLHPRTRKNLNPSRVYPGSIP